MSNYSRLPTPACVRARTRDFWHFGGFIFFCGEKLENGEVVAELLYWYGSVCMHINVRTYMPQASFGSSFGHITVTVGDPFFTPTDDNRDLCDADVQTSTHRTAIFIPHSRRGGCSSPGINIHTKLCFFEFEISSQDAVISVQHVSWAPLSDGSCIPRAEQVHEGTLCRVPVLYSFVI